MVLSASELSTTTLTTGARVAFDPGFAILTNAPTRRF